MRRPSPLPSTPRQSVPPPSPGRSARTVPTPKAEAESESDEAVAASPPEYVRRGNAGGADAAGVTSVVGDRPADQALGGFDFASRPLPLPREPRDTAGAESDETVGEVPTSLRDVWRAARARRRALRAEVRRFTARQRRRRLIAVGVAASLVLLVLATLGAAYSPLFGVERITVVGTSQLDPTAVAAALDGQLGTPLPLVDESAVKAALVAFPLVESYTLEARPPHELVVRIVERTPVGVISSAAGYTLVDAAGVALSTTAAIPAGQPVITVAAGAQSDAFAALGQVIRSLPESVRPQVTAATATTPDDVTLTLGGTRTTVVWGSADDSAEKAVALAAAMKARPPASVSEYDVSSPSAVVVR
ncbi:MAG: FtsQ-type POTRA domain-containing protein [Actinobacteria bacterium]|nr:FtsQ-type POTRA domain-containing protein [Actinomycetota bacterium]